MSLSRLPNELLSKIAGYLHTQDIASLRSTNKHLARALHVSLYDSIHASGLRDSARKALYYGAARRDHWLVSRLIQQGVGSLAADGALLNDAIRRECSEEIVRIFIDCGAKINKPSNFGVTPLAAAAGRGRLDLVELLLSRGAEAKTESMPHCPLMQAARSGHADAFRLVLHAYPGAAELNSVDHYGRTLLHWLTFSNCPEGISVLVRNTMVDVNIRDIGGSTPFVVAAQMNYNHIAWILISSGRADANLADASGETPLHKAARFGNVGLVRMLVESDGVNSAPINQRGKSPLMLARRRSKQAVVDLLERYIS
ncbi:ankyrin repeat-containing domain protein [Tuber indicum]|nr:ankyrin repeat-containing domain protein [Tuber indicum]